MAAPARKTRTLVVAQEESGMDEQVFALMRDRFRALDGRMDDQDEALKDIGQSVKALADSMGARVGALEQEQDSRRTAAETHALRDQRFSKRTKALWGAVYGILTLAAVFLGPQVHLF